MKTFVLIFELIALGFELVCLVYAIKTLIEINKLDKEIRDIFKKD